MDYFVHQDQVKKLQLPAHSQPFATCPQTYWLDSLQVLSKRLIGTTCESKKIQAMGRQLEVEGL